MTVYTILTHTACRVRRTAHICSSVHRGKPGRATEGPRSVHRYIQLSIPRYVPHPQVLAYQSGATQEPHHEPPHSELRSVSLPVKNTAEHAVSCCGTACKRGPLLDGGCNGQRRTAVQDICDASAAAPRLGRPQQTSGRVAASTNQKCWGGGPRATHGLPIRSRPLCSDQDARQVAALSTPDS